MIVQLLVALGLALVAVAVAAWLRGRHRHDGPTQGPAWDAPRQLDRRDFERPEAEWLVVVFSSATCESCASMVDQARALASDAVAVTEVEVGAQPELHRRYRIEAVPITVVADRAGVVRASFIGPASATDLWAAVGAAPE